MHRSRTPERPGPAGGPARGWAGGGDRAGGSGPAGSGSPATGQVDTAAGGSRPTSGGERGRLAAASRIDLPDAGTRASGRRPIRTCIGCRQRDADAHLLRMVVVAGSVVADPDRRLPGRGAWLHPDPRCLAQAQRRNAFGRALRVGPDVDTTSVRLFLDSVSGPDGGVPPAPGRGIRHEGNEVEPS